MMMLHLSGGTAAWADVPLLPCIGLAAAAVCYVRGYRAARRGLARDYRASRVAHTRVARARGAAFVAGWLALAAALISPLHAAGEALLSMHMVQHVILMAGAAPLLVWSMPVGTLVRGLPRALVAPATGMMRHVAPLRRRATRPATAIVLQMAVLWVWHMPAMYQASVRYATVHALQHSTLLIAALLYWASIPLHARAHAHHRARVMTGIASLFATTLQMGALAALFTFSRLPWYDVYVTHGSAAALADQQLAGVLMWVPGGIPYMVVALTFVWRLLSGHQAVRAPARAAAGVALCLVAVAGTGCNRPSYGDGESLAHGDARRGQHLIKSYGCVACHIVPGVSGGDAHVGPALSGLKQRVYIAGVIPNSPENLVAWVQDPKKIDSATAMPKVGVSEADAKDIASYLYSIR
jgi:cytochrome c oxidase assembly factor CtaG/cytochrome c2